MRILYIAERFAPFVGGIETMSKHLLSALAGQGHAVTIVTSHCDAPLPDRELWRGMPLHRLSMLTALAAGDLKVFARAAAELKRIKAESTPDLVHIQFSGPSSLFHWRTQGDLPVPTLLTVHSVPQAPIAGRSLMIDTLERADWIAPVSGHMLDWLSARAPGIVGKSSVVRNGIPPGDVPEMIAQVPSDAPEILWVGRMVEWKRVDRLVRAVHLLGDRHPHLRLTLAGDGPERGTLEALARELGIADRVRFPGWVDGAKRSALIDRATLVAIPSSEVENLPMAALEAAARGRPVVASRVSGLPEIVGDGNSGLLLDDVTPASLATAIATLIDDPARARQMGEAAQRRVRSDFTQAGMVAAYLDLYHRLSGGDGQ